MKLCRMCNEWIPRDKFTPSKKASDGLQSYCRACYAKRASERRKNISEYRMNQAAYSASHRDEINAKRRARRAANPVKTKAERAANYAKRRDRELEAMRRWKNANRERMQARQHERYWADPDAARKRQMDYRRQHPGKARAWTMNRVAGKIRATPPWADKKAIEAIYKRAAMLSRATGVPHEVDHIVPLRAERVNGLHCEANLQILTRAANRKKSNHFSAAMSA